VKNKRYAERLGLNSNYKNLCNKNNLFSQYH